MFALQHLCKARTESTATHMRTPDEFLIVGYSHAAAAVARKETYKYNVVVEST